MSKRLEFFSNYVEFQTPIDITIGDGGKILAFGKGDIYISTFNGINWTDLYISNALYVPAIYANLLSYGQIVDKGY